MTKDGAVCVTVNSNTADVKNSPPVSLEESCSCVSQVSEETATLISANTSLTTDSGVLDEGVVICFPAVGRGFLVLNNVALDLLATIILRLGPHQGH